MSFTLAVRNCELCLDPFMLEGSNQIRIHIRFAFLPQKTTENQQQEIQFLPLGGTGVNGMLCDNLIRLFLSTARGKSYNLLKFEDLVNVNRNRNISLQEGLTWVIIIDIHDRLERRSDAWKEIKEKKNKKKRYSCY